MSSHGPLPAECGPANEAARTPVHVTQQGRLAGVVVAGSDFVRMREPKARTHRVVIEHCRLQPSLIAATSGDKVLVENRDDFPFEPLLGPSFGARALPRGETRELTTPGAGLEALQCSLGAPCGRSDLLTFLHTIHAVTDAEGRFRIDDFPAQELVRVTAWHPLFETTENFVWLEPGQTTSLPLELHPKARFVLQPTAAATP